MEVNKCHFIGIGGIGMSGLARLLLRDDTEVSGSDAASNYVTESLISEGVKVHLGHSSQNISPDMTVVYTTGIHKNNPEFEAARQLNCAMMHRSDMLLHLMQGYKTLAVAGTHGKTTTSSLLAWVLESAGMDPTFAIGGIVPQFRVNAKRGTGEYFVAEACESDGTFLKYHPYGAILTNVDFDHMDYYKTETALLQAFKSFSGKALHPEHFFWCGDDELSARLHLPGYSYGFGEECAVRILNFRQDNWQTVFDLDCRGVLYTNITLALVGRHNALNAAGVFGLASSLGILEENIREAFGNFKGVKRRCQLIGDAHSVQVIDDYAHHPTEVMATLSGLREAVKERRIIAVFQPHRFTRTRDCLKAFGSSFGVVDEVIITDIYSANEEPIEGITAERVVAEVSLLSRLPVQYVKRDALVEMLAEMVRPHDVVITLGAGDISAASAKLAAFLVENPPKKYRVGVVLGGRSREHEVSLISSKCIIDSLDRNFYEVEIFGIHKTGSWITGEDTLDRLGEPSDNRSSMPSHVMEKLMACDILFPILHGPFGEDGTIQGFFDILDKAYVGCDHRSAALCMDKALTKRIASLAGLPVVPFVSFSRQEWSSNSESLLEKIAKELIFPVFVKPLHLGSSVGIKKIHDLRSLPEAIRQVFEVDTEALVENGLSVREIEFAVSGNDRIETYPPGEVLAAGRVFDYEAKYGVHAVPVIDCADLPHALIREGMKLAKEAYKALSCKGMARVDFFLDEKGHYWLNEINPIPGFTPLSLYPRICARYGMDRPALMDRLLILGLERKRHNQRSLEKV